MNTKVIASKEATSPPHIDIALCKKLFCDLLEWAKEMHDKQPKSSDLIIPKVHYMLSKEKTLIKLWTEFQYDILGIFEAEHPVEINKLKVLVEAERLTALVSIHNLMDELDRLKAAPVVKISPKGIGQAVVDLSWFNHQLGEYYNELVQYYTNEKLQDRVQSLEARLTNVYGEKGSWRHNASGDVK